ncbi:glycosyltransferase family 4 protein [Microbacterium shaanxiense]
MRLAVVTRIYRPEPAAASIFLGAVVDSALGRGMLVDVYTASPPRGTPSQTRGERVRSWPVLRDSTGYVRGYTGYVSFDVPLFFRLLFGPRPDAVLVEPPPTSGAVVRAVCALRRIPYVYDAADIWSDAVQLEPVPGVVVRVLRAVEQFALRGAAHIVTVSQGVVGRIRALGSGAPATVTGFGADATQFTYLEMPAEKLFVYAGSYSPYHGADILVDGFARVSEQHPGYVLRFIGNGASRDAVEERARELGVFSQVEFLQPVTPSALLPHLNAAVASLATIKPETVYEYSYASKAFSSFMTGCPVIFAGSGPTIDLIDEAKAAGVRAGAACAYDAEAIAAQLVESVESLTSAEERRDLARWASRNHSLQAVADRVVDVISATASGVGT